MHIFIPIIPLWFYGFDSVVYFIASLIGFLLSFYFHKMYSFSSEKKHKYLYLGFLLLSFGFLLISFTNTYSYLNFKNCRVSCTLGLIGDVFSLEDYSYFTFFGLSLLAYSFFVLAYWDENFKHSRTLIFLFLIYMLMVFIFLPRETDLTRWYSFVGYFHMISLAMMAFVSFKNFLNYKEKKSLNSLMVFYSFAFLSLFHLFYLISFMNEWMYVFSHLFMLIGFTTLLAMVLRVKRK